MLQRGAGAQGRHDREAIIESLRDKLRESHENLVGNMGYREYLTLMLMKELESRLAERGHSYEWQDIKQDLATLQQIKVAMNDEPMNLRPELSGYCSDLLKATGAAVFNVS